MRLLYTLTFSILCCLALSAQTIWTGDISTDWNNSGNWSAGVPTAGMTATIPGSTTSGNFPIYSGNPVIDFTIQNAGAITFNDFVYNEGTIINFNVGTLVNNNSFFVNAGSVIFDNDGVFTNTGTFENFGTFDNAASATFTNASGATLINQGLFRNNGVLENEGTVLNHGMIRSTTDFQNSGQVDNYAFFENPFGSIATNNTGATITNHPDAIFSHNGNFQNDGAINNDGRFEVRNAGNFTHEGSFNNNGHLEISGELLNNSAVNNNGTIKVNDAGTLNNKNNFANTGSIETAICGIIIQDSPINIAGPVLHDGIVYELQGTVDVTIVEFGNVFDDLSQTKPPVPGCQSGGIVQLDENGEGTLELAQVDKGGYASCGATLVSKTLSETEYTLADLGAQNVTLTVEDNLGATASCVATIFVVEFVAPIVAVDDPNIEFECPADITATPEPGASIVDVSWPEPADPTTNCTAGAPCASRSATNTTQCHNDEVYGFYIRLAGENYHYDLSNGAFVEFEDGTAQLSGNIISNSNSDYTFDLNVSFSGRTSNTPSGSPKANSCNSFDADHWYYYTETNGVLTGTGVLSGAEIELVRAGEAFQVGVGANTTDDTNAFGASGWLDVDIISQPTSGPTLSIDTGNSDADINIMLSGDPGACVQQVQCNNIDDDIPGFIFMGEYNDSKYYCSNTSDHTWASAKSQAESIGGFLAIVDGNEENEFIRQNILADYAWIGLSDEETEGMFRWVNGETLTYSNWSSGEPNNSGGVEDYARILKSSGKWTDRDEHFEAEFVVEIPCSNVPLSCNELVEDISGFIFLGEYNSSKYFISDHPANWTTANFNASANGGHLVSINDASENSFIQNSIYPASGSIWIGLNNVDSPGTFQWTNGDPVDYMNWQAGEPNGGDYDNAARMKKSSGEWTDREVDSYSYEYVIEIPCEDTPPPPPSGNGELTVEIISGPGNGENFALGVTEVIYRVTDDCGNEEICIFTVTVEENPAEITVICPDNINVDALPGADVATADWIEPSATTTCFKPEVNIDRIDDGPANGDLFPVGTTFISYAVTDSCNNFSNCVFSVTVNAVEPGITIENCPEDFTTNPTDFIWDEPTFSTTCFIGTVSIEQVEGPDLGSTPEVGTYQISYLLHDECENTAVCIFNVTVESGCPADGTPCDDGDDCTTGDVEDGNCNCAGIYADSDGDGVCDAEDICNGGDDTVDSDGDGIPDFCDDCSVVGQPCDDGDACTEGDVFDANCNCAGIYADSDGDGVCDAEDICNGGDDTVDSDGDGIPDFCDDCSVVGQPCDDGDACTEGDVFDANCNCAGIYADSDGDGVCDAEDICNGGDDTIDSDGDGIPDFCDDCIVVGQPCDDGDACTEGDVFDANCNCAGIYADSDGDGVCDAEDICNGGDDTIDSDGDGIPDFCDDCSVVGQPCDDGDACTEGDVFDANCNCAGIYADSDGDGVCDAEDICNGGDDTVDSDGDGIPDFCDDCSVVGQPCDDGDACTEGDVFDANCNCAGIYADSDGDGVCDAEDICNGGDDTVDSDGDGIPDFCDDDEPLGDPCDELVLTIGSGSLTVSNVNAPIFNVFVFNAVWATEFNCNFSCTDPTVVDLAPGTYIVKVNLRDANWVEICEYVETITITDGCAFEPGTTCDDGDDCTVGDVYDADCNCAGIFADSDHDGVCDADDQCDGFDDTLDDDGDGIPNGCDNDVCDNVTNGGEIAGDEIGCIGYDPGMITSITSPSGGSGPIEYIWLASTTGCPVNLSQIIPGATGETFNPGTISETTFFIRCSRRADCEDWSLGESNCVVKTVDDSDSDGDGICDLEDICDGGDDHLDSDGDGIPDFCDNNDPGDDLCEALTFDVGPGNITVSNINAPIFNVFVFNANWGTEFNCNFSCTNPTVIDLAPGTYYVKVELRDAGWAPICERMETVTVTEACGFEPGTPCNDGDDCTTGDVYDADCNCAGIYSDSDGDGVCDADDICEGFDDNLDSDNDGIPDGCDSNECDNVTDGGEIEGDEIGCIGYDPSVITSAVSPSGGSGPIQYIWLSAVNGCPTDLSQIIPGATNATYDPEMITETTYYVRCSRRADCDEWTIGESNCVIKTVDDSDVDGDGVCDTDDLCEGGDDTVDVDNDGIPDACDDQIGSDNPCDNIQIVAADSVITVSGIDAPIFTVMIFNQQWQTVYNCGFTCASPTIADGIPEGDYFVSVKLYDEYWQPICEIMPLVSVTGGGDHFIAGEEIFDFQAQGNGRVVSVYWATNSEVNNDHFVIERSADGISFEALESVNSITDNRGTYNYFETDQDPYLGANYYRIAKVHKDGSIKYSMSRKVEFDIDLSDTAIFPNPATNEIFVNLDEFSGRKATISIFNQFGQRLELNLIDYVEELPYRFDISKYPAGAYTMYIEMEGTRNFSKKFIISRL